MLPGIFFPAGVSVAAALLASFLNLPVLTLQGIHTYIHPDSLPAAGGPKAVLRRPGDTASSLPDLKRRSRSKDPDPVPDESKAQLFRLSLTDSFIPSRLFFTSYRSSFLSSFISLCTIAISTITPSSDPYVAVSFAAAVVSASHLFVSLLSLSLERTASRFSERRLSLLSALIGFISTLFILVHLSPSVIDFRISGALSFATACLAGFLGGVLFTPTARTARSFWIGTDQLRWNLSVVSCGTFCRFILYTSVILCFFSPLLWVKPLASSERFVYWRVPALAAAAGSQLLVFRINVQMYLNEAVLCWYQRLHSSRVPDMDYSRAKVFLHNHYACLVAIQFFAPPVLVLLLVGLSQLRGNLFNGIPLTGGLINFSDLVKEMTLFIAWWIMFVQSILTMVNLAFYRFGFAFIS